MGVTNGQRCQGNCVLPLSPPSDAGHHVYATTNAEAARPDLPSDTSPLHTTSTDTLHKQRSRCYADDHRRRPRAQLTTTTSRRRTTYMDRQYLWHRGQQASRLAARAIRLSMATHVPVPSDHTPSDAISTCTTKHGTSPSACTEGTARQSDGSYATRTRAMGFGHPDLARHMAATPYDGRRDAATTTSGTFGLQQTTQNRRDRSFGAGRTEGADRTSRRHRAVQHELAPTLVSRERQGREAEGARQLQAACGPEDGEGRPWLLSTPSRRRWSYPTDATGADDIAQAATTYYEGHFRSHDNDAEHAATHANSIATRQANDERWTCGSGPRSNGATSWEWPETCMPQDLRQRPHRQRPAAGSGGGRPAHRNMPSLGSESTAAMEFTPQ